MKLLKQKIRESLGRREMARRRTRQRRIDAGDIVFAVSWARSHFNVGAPDTVFDPPAFDIEVDYGEGQITVWPKLYGRRCALAFPATYQLCRERGRLMWKGMNPLSVAPLVLEIPQP